MFNERRKPVVVNKSELFISVYVTDGSEAMEDFLFINLACKHNSLLQKALAG